MMVTKPSKRLQVETPVVKPSARFLFKGELELDQNWEQKYFILHRAKPVVVRASGPQFMALSFTELVICTVPSCEPSPQSPAESQERDYASNGFFEQVVAVVFEKLW